MLQEKRSKWRRFSRKIGMIGLAMLLLLPNMLIHSELEVYADEADFEVSVVGETVTITGYLGTETDVVIPEQIGGKDVTVIGIGAFFGSGLQSVTLNEGLVEIGTMAFAGNSFDRIDIPSTVKTIGDGAFSQGSLRTLTLREGLKTIGDSAFWDNEIQSLYIPDGVEAIGEEAFIGNKLEDVRLPGTITFIGNHAFIGEEDKNNIHTLILEDGLSSIGEGAFKDNSLESVRIPGSVTVIEKEAFMGNAIQTLILDEGVEEIGEQAFMHNKLNKVVIPGTVNTVGNGAFAFNPLTEVKVYNDGLIIVGWPFVPPLPATPADVTLIGHSGSTTEQYAIDNGHPFQLLQVCGENTDFECVVNDDDTVTITGYDDHATKDVVIPDTIDGKTVVAIGERAFASKGLTSVTIPDSVTDIGERALSYNQLISLTLPNSLRSIQVGAFQANQLTSVVIPNLVVNIGQYAFHDNQLTSVTIPNSVEIIGYGAFWMNKLTEITLPNSVKFIGALAFSENELTSVTIPDSVENIREESFGKNPLTKVQFEGAVLHIGLDAFTAPFYDAEFEGWYTDANYEHAWDHTVPGPMTIYGKWEGNCGEECLIISLTPSETNPTNQDVTISVSVNKLPESIRELKWGIGDKALAYFQAGNGADVIDGQFTVTQNGVYTVYAKDKAGNERVEKITIANIDKSLLIIHVQIGDGKTITLHAYGSDSVQQLKQRIQDAEGIATEKQKITIGGQVLEDGRTLADYNIPDQATLQLTVESSVATPNPGGGGGVYIPSSEAPSKEVASSDRSLDKLEAIVDGKNRLPFAPTQFEYDLGDTEAETVEIIVKAHHPKAKITLNGEAFVDEQTLLLNEGKNIFDIVIFAENGDKQTYTITLNRLEQVPFTDIAGHWAEGYIKKTYRERMFYGYSDQTFRPDDPISRMEVTSILVRLLELDEQKQVPFTDVQSIGKDVMEELEKAYANGVAKGYPDQTFKPNAELTRAHLALLFYRTYEKTTGTPYQPKSLAYFPDIARYNQETQNAIAMLVELNIAEGSGGNFMPNEQATRAQAAKMLVNFKEVLGRLENK